MGSCRAMLECRPHAANTISSTRRDQGMQQRLPAGTYLLCQWVPTSVRCCTSTATEESKHRMQSLTHSLCTTIGPCTRLWESTCRNCWPRFPSFSASISLVLCPREDSTNAKLCARDLRRTRLLMITHMHIPCPRLRAYLSTSPGSHAASGHGLGPLGTMRVPSPFSTCPMLVDGNVDQCGQLP